MIVKMKFLSITGPKTDIDRITRLYLSKYEIQLEHAMSELKSVDNLRPFSDVNPYKDALTKVEQFLTQLDTSHMKPDTSLPEDKITDAIRSCGHDHTELTEQIEHLKKTKETLIEKRNVIKPFQSLDFNVRDVLQYEFIRFRFGRVAISYYQKFEKYLYDNLDAIFIEGERDENYVYGVYFVAHSQTNKIDSVLKSLHFERTFLPDDYEGTPSQAYRNLQQKIEAANEEITQTEQRIKELFHDYGPKLLQAKLQLEDLSKNFDVRKVAACIEDKHEDYYILCGWMAESDVEKFLHDVRDDDRIFVVVEDDRSKFFGEPPTKLKNPKVFRPFEMFVDMYGLPAHNEMDPTIFVALTYTLIFGIMFGDVGQGLCLFVIGGLIYLIKKAKLAGIISVAGIFSTFFGFMFGSVFGFEDIIEPRWLRPLTQMSNVPFIGKLNTIFIAAIAFGMLLIVISIIFQIVNALRAKDVEHAFFDANGLAGLVFYGSFVAVVVLFMTGRKLPGAIVLAVMFGVPLIAIALKEPIMHRIEKKAGKMESSAGMYLVQTFFELFETLLSYFSNTLSFVRIGAFAVSHAAMMEVVLMLAGAESGHPNWIVIVLGNIFVSGMEGLIVGIQVLRLEYYEMFSRFYKGTGRAFKPYKKKRV